MHGQLVDDAVLRRANVDALELVLGGDLAFLELGGLGAHLAQLLGHIRLDLLVDLEDLQLGLADLALGLGDARLQRSALALEPRGVAFERGERG